MSALNKLPVLKNRIVRTYQKTVYGRRQLDWDRVPEALRETARRNEYLAANPYPVEQIVREFKPTPFLTPQTLILTMGSGFAQELGKQYDYMFYMPSFEITRSNPTDNYEADGRHVNNACVDTIIDAFRHMYVSA